MSGYSVGNHFSKANDVFSCCASLLGVSTRGFAQDVLLQNQEGEILLQPESEPTYELAPVDPSYDKKKQAANKRKGQHEETLRQINDALIVSNKKRKELEDSVAALDDDRSVLEPLALSSKRKMPFWRVRSGSMILLCVKKKSENL